MSEQRFIVETVMITDCCTDESRIAKVVTDTNELYSYDDLYEFCDELNHLYQEKQELEKENKRLKRLENKVKQIPPKIKEVWLE